MELADNTYLDGDGESVLKALEEANPQTIEPSRSRRLACNLLLLQGLINGG